MEPTIKKFLNKIKLKIEKINFGVVTISLLTLFVLSLILLWTGNKDIGPMIFILVIIAAFFFSMAYLFKKIIDDIETIIFFFAIVVTYMSFIIWIGNLVHKLVPQFYPTDTSEMYNLYTNSINTFISSGIGISGTLLGALYGGKKSLEVAERQFSKQNEDNEIRKEENRRMVIRIITKFLKEEIIDNKIIFEKKNFYETINGGFGTQRLYNGWKDKVKFDSYENIKYELIKFANERLVEDVIDLYGVLYIFARYDDIKELDEKEFNKLAKLELLINGVIEKIDSQE